jgi:hypothetical protein
MPQCPRCGERGIGWTAKLLSNERFPAKCDVCGCGCTKTMSTMWGQLAAATVMTLVLPLFAPSLSTRAVGFSAIAAAAIVGMIGPLRETLEI